MAVFWSVQVFDFTRHVGLKHRRDTLTHMNLHWIQTTAAQPWAVQPESAVKTASASAATSAAPAATQLRIGTATGQKILGFGGCFNELGTIALNKAQPDVRREVLDALFHPTQGCAFNYCRLPIGANDYAAE
jgi:glucosylceramidase